jgi:sugar phosphate isomerase/epimerase
MAELCFNTFNRSAWHGIDPDLPAQIAAAGRAGFRWFGPDHYSLDHWTAAGRPLDELAGMIADAGMAVWEITGLNVGERDATVAEAEHLAALASVFRPQWVLTNVGAPLDDAAFAAFDEACGILADAGCRPAVEYLPFTPAYDIATAAVLVDAVGRDRAKILFDSWHHFRGPDTWAELEAAPLDLVAYLQFDDARPVISDDLVDETVNRRAFPGEGEFELDRWCETMRAKGFDGVVSVEVLETDFRARGAHDEFARRAFETSARFWPPAS